MKLHLHESTDILFKTMPFVLMRMLAYLAFSAAAIIYFSIFLLIGYVFSWNAIALILFALGTGAFFIVLRLVREYFLYLLKAGHIAVITELITTGQLSSAAAVNQISYGKQKVIGLFKEVTILFVVDRLVNSVLRTFTRWTMRISRWMPIPGLEMLASFIGKIAQMSIGFVDEAILSYSIAKGNPNLWQSAKEGIILFCQMWRPILLNATVMALISNFIFIVVFLPGVGIAALVSNQVMRFVVGGAFLLLALVIKFGFVNPLALVSTIVTFHREIVGMVPNAEWESRLEGISSKFKDISQRARSYSPPAT